MFIENCIAFNSGHKPFHIMRAEFFVQSLKIMVWILFCMFSFYLLKIKDIYICFLGQNIFDVTKKLFLFDVMLPPFNQPVAGFGQYCSVTTNFIQSTSVMVVIHSSTCTEPHFNGESSRPSGDE